MTRDLIKIWCRTCGRVDYATAVLPLPICRHGIGIRPGPAAARTELLPDWHPLFSEPLTFRPPPYTHE